MSRNIDFEIAVIYLNGRDLAACYYFFFLLHSRTKLERREVNERSLATRCFYKRKGVRNLESVCFSYVMGMNEFVKKFVNRSEKKMQIRYTVYTECRHAIANCRPTKYLQF